MTQSEGDRLAWVLRGLLRAAARLALPADDQREYLRRLGVEGSTDELALEFGEFALMLDQLEEVDWIEPPQATLVRRIDGMLSEMSGEQNAALWRPEALSIAPEWTEVRALAKDLIFALDRTDSVIVPMRIL